MFDECMFNLQNTSYQTSFNGKKIGYNPDKVIVGK